jgi:hypothetical protein
VKSKSSDLPRFLGCRTHDKPSNSFGVISTFLSYSKIGLFVHSVVFLNTTTRGNSIGPGEYVEPTYNAPQHHQVQLHHQYLAESGITVIVHFDLASGSWTMKTLPRKTLILGKGDSERGEKYSVALLHNTFKKVVLCISARSVQKP